MKNFNQFLTEEMMPFAATEKGFVGVDNGPVRDNINIILTQATARPFPTPYLALETVRRVLMSFHIALPATNFMDGEEGQEVFSIDQFGAKVGALNNGDVVTKSSDPYYVYFEYEMNDSGSFDIFCEIVNDAELEDILDDIEEDDEDEEEDLDEQSELKMGTKDETEEHGMSKAEAEKTAKDHLRKDKHYYSKMKKIGLEENEMSEEQLDELSAGKMFKYVRDAKSDRKQALADRDHYKKNLTDPDKAWTKGIPHKDSQYKMAADRNARASKRTKSINLAVKKIANKSKVDEGLKMGDYGHLKAKEAAKAPFDNPTEKPSTPYKNSGAKAKQLARAAMNKAKKVAEDYDHKAKADHDETKNIASGATRKSDKKKWKSFVKHDNDRAVTGMEGRKEGKKLDEVSFGLAHRAMKSAENKGREYGSKAYKAHLKSVNDKRLSDKGKAKAAADDVAHQKTSKKKWGQAAKFRDYARKKLDEVSHELAKKAERKSFKQYYDAYDAETDARKKYIKSKDPKDKPATDSTKEKRLKIAKRTASLQKFAAKKKPVKEETISEISAGKAEKAYQKTMDKMNWHDHVAGVLRRGGFKDSEKREVDTSTKLRKKAVKFADYVDKKKFSEETKQLEFRPTSIPDKDKGPFTKNLKIIKKTDCEKK